MPLPIRCGPAGAPEGAVIALVPGRFVSLLRRKSLPGRFQPPFGAPGPRPRAGLRVRRFEAPPGPFGPPSPGPLYALFINAKKS